MEMFAFQMDSFDQLPNKFSILNFVWIIKKFHCLTDNIISMYNAFLMLFRGYYESVAFIFGSVKTFISKNPVLTIVQNNLKSFLISILILLLLLLGMKWCLIHTQVKLSINEVMTINVIWFLFWLKINLHRQMVTKNNAIIFLLVSSIFPSILKIQNIPPKK